MNTEKFSAHLTAASLESDKILSAKAEVSGTKLPDSDAKSAEAGHAAVDSSTKKPTPSKPSKKFGNKNALCHGLYADELKLPWESEKDFESLLANFKDEWQPCGESENQTVLELTNYTWIGWRAAKLPLLNYHQAPFGGDLVESGKMTWRDMLKAEEGVPQVAGDMVLCAEALLSSQKLLYDLVQNQKDITTTAEGKDAQLQKYDLKHRIDIALDKNKEMVKIIEGAAAIADQASQRFAKAYQPEVIETQVRVMAMVDARIDKMLRRLISLKEYKRCAAPPPPTNVPMIQSPATAPTGKTQIRHAKRRKKTVKAKTVKAKKG